MPQALKTLGPAIVDASNTAWCVFEMLARRRFDADDATADQAKKFRAVGVDRLNFLASATEMSPHLRRRITQQSSERRRVYEDPVNPIAWLQLRRATRHGTAIGYVFADLKMDDKKARCSIVIWRASL